MFNKKLTFIIAVTWVIIYMQSISTTNAMRMNDYKPDESSPVVDSLHQEEDKSDDVAGINSDEKKENESVDKQEDSKVDSKEDSKEDDSEGEEPKPRQKSNKSSPEENSSDGDKENESNSPTENSPDVSHEDPSAVEEENSSPTSDQNSSDMNQEQENPPAVEDGNPSVQDTQPYIRHNPHIENPSDTPANVDEPTRNNQPSKSRSSGKKIPTTLFDKLKLMTGCDGPACPGKFEPICVITDGHMVVFPSHCVLGETKKANPLRDYEVIDDSCCATFMKYCTVPQLNIV